MRVWNQPRAVQIGQNIREKRKSLGLSQSVLAQGLFSVQTMSLIERGKLGANENTLEVLAERLNCPVDDLLVMKHDLQEDWLRDLLETARRFQTAGRREKAIEVLHTLYTESFAKNSTLYLLESSYGLCLLYHETGRHRASTDWGLEALRLLQPDEDLERALTLYSTIGHNSYILGEIWDAYERLREAETLVDQHGHISEQTGRLYYTMAILKQVLRNWEGCVWYSTRALQIFEQYDMVVFIGRTLMMLGTAHKNLGRTAKASQHIERSIRILSQTSDLSSLARSYHSLAELEFTLGHLDKARKNFLRSLTYKRQSHDTDGALYTLRSLAQLAQQTGQMEEARHYLQDALDRTEKHGLDLQRAVTLRCLGDLALQEGLLDDYTQLYKQAIEIFERFSYSTELAESAERLGNYYLEIGRERLAVPYLRLANLHYRKLLQKS